MKKQTKSTLSKWLFWAPFKFSMITMLSMLILFIIYIITADLILATPVWKLYAPLFAILALFTFAYCIRSLFRALPTHKMNQRNYITITIGQTLLYSLFSFSILILTIKTFNPIAPHTTVHIPTFFIIAFLILITCLYMSGLILSNLYATYLRCREFNIPTWKFILSIPFGITMLYSAGYLLPETQNKKDSLEIKSKWYQGIIDWTLRNKTNTIASFIATTFIGVLFGGLNAALLTFTLALIYGIWVLQVGEKNLQKTINKKYSTTAIIINIALIIATISMFAFFTKQTAELQTNATIETLTIETIDTTQPEQQ